MATNVIPLRESQVKLVIDGKQHLGIHIAHANNSHAAKQFKEDTKNQGLIIKDKEITDWDTQGLIEHDGEIYLYGPIFEGRTVDEALRSEPKNALSYVHQLVRSLVTIKERSQSLPRFQANGILFLDDGGLLFFPPALMQRIRATQIESDRLRTYERYNNPDLEGEQSLSFSLAVLCYRLFTGVDPFPADNEEDIHNRMREHQPAAPQLLVPEIKKGVSDDVSSSLDKGSEKSLTLEEWDYRLARWDKEGVRESIAEVDKDKLLESGRRFTQKAESSYRRKVFLRVHGRLIFFIGVIAVLFGSVGGSILRNALAPPVTAGMGPREVVELFYTSITDLEHMAMEDCVTDGAGKPEVTEATNLFVITRMRVGQEGNTGYYPADRWVEAGKPELNPGYAVYGVAELEITAISEIEYTVEYLKYEQRTGDFDDPESYVGGSVAYQRMDRVLLRQDKKGYWVIYSLERLENEQVEEVR